MQASENPINNDLEIEFAGPVDRCEPLEMAKPAEPAAEPAIVLTAKQEAVIAGIISWYEEAFKAMYVEYDQSEFGEVRIPTFKAGQFKQVLYLAGYAGTGKSTIVAEAIKRIREKFKVHEIIMGAYTGKAAYVLRKKGNHGAQTIHSMIYKCVEDEETHQLTFILNILGPAAQADLIILDECSMIDTLMGNDLLSFGKPILVMGDPGQLPPINGDGIFTMQKPDYFLDEIHRQAAESPIIELATMARQGIMPPVGYNKDGVRVLQLTNATADEYLHNPDTQVLCGLNRIRWAVTQILRREQGYGDMLPMIGEKILCCKNNKKIGLFNGGMGTLELMNTQRDGLWKVNCTIEGQKYKDLIIDPYLFQQHFNDGASQRNYKLKPETEMDWGYILSVHKAQGSSWNHVTLIDNSSSFR